MSAELALSIVSVAQAIREGIVLAQDLQDLADSDEDLTPEAADAIIDEVLEEIRENMRNNEPDI